MRALGDTLIDLLTVQLARMYDDDPFLFVTLSLGPSQSVLPTHCNQSVL